MFPYLMAAAISLVLIGVHLHSGGAEVVRPLVRSKELQPEVVYVLYLCWHVVTIIMAAFVIAYAGAAFHAAFRPFALAATIMAGAIALWSFVVVVWKRQSHRKMPQWGAFLLLTVSGIWAVYRDSLSSGPLEL